MTIWDRTATVAQAQGIVTVQADCTLDEALQMMSDRARVAHRSLLQIAEATVAHQIWFR